MPARLPPLRWIIGCVAIAAAAHAHPIHTSLAEADYNRATNKLEVALKVFADDFENALGTHAKQKVSLEQTPRTEFEKLTRAYLADRFTLKSADGAKAKLEFIGREWKEASNELWLFFELTHSGELEGATLHHAVLAEQFADQINSVALRDGERRQTLVFLASHKEKRIRFRPN